MGNRNSGSELIARRLFILVLYEYPYNVIPKIIPKPTPSLVLYTDIVGLTQSHTERYLPWTDPNRFLYSVLAVMGYLSPILCVTATCSTSTGTCYYFLFFGRFFGRTSLWL